MKPGPPVQCPCCRCVGRRAAHQRYYLKNRQAIIKKNAEAKRKLKRKRKAADLSPEVSDEELDRRALLMGMAG